MNVIFACGHDLGAVTDNVKAAAHKHWMLQLFLCAAGEMEISVAGVGVRCRGIIVDMNTAHQFGTSGRAHLTMLIDPVSALGRRLSRQYINGQRFYVLPDELAHTLQNKLSELLDNINAQTLGGLIGQIHQAFENEAKGHVLDDRVRDVIRLIEECPCKEKHRLASLAQAVALSESRLAHLFKEKTGVPLKSYLVLHELHKAYAVLAEGGSVTDAAMAAGFDSPSHLAYTNRKMTGMSASGIIKDSEFLKVLIP